MRCVNRSIAGFGIGDEAFILEVNGVPRIRCVAKIARVPGFRDTRAIFRTQPCLCKHARMTQGIRTMNRSAAEQGRLESAYSAVPHPTQFLLFSLFCVPQAQVRASLMTSSPLVPVPN